YHTRSVAQGSKRSFLVTDMPFGSYQESPQQAFRSAAELMAAGAQMVKLEGGAEFADTIRFLTQRGVPVCGHLGLTPQSVHQFGGYRVQGRGREAADALREDAIALTRAGCFALVLEGVPLTLGRDITETIGIPTIGIGAGPQCDGQVLVLHDLIGMSFGKPARFVRRYAETGDTIRSA